MAFHVAVTCIRRTVHGETGERQHGYCIQGAIPGLMTQMTYRIRFCVIRYQEGLMTLFESFVLAALGSIVSALWRQERPTGRYI